MKHSNTNIKSTLLKSLLLASLILFPVVVIASGGRRHISWPLLLVDVTHHAGRKFVIAGFVHGCSFAWPLFRRL